MKSRTKIRLLGIIPIIALIITILVMSIKTEAQTQEPVDSTPIPTIAPTLTPTPTSVPRFLQFNGTSVLDLTQPILTVEYKDPKNNYGYADANEIRVKEIGLEQGTGNVIWRIKLKTSAKIIEERYATEREVRAYQNYISNLQEKQIESSRIQNFKTKQLNFDKLTAGQKDVLLKELLDEVIRLNEN